MAAGGRGQEAGDRLLVDFYTRDDEVFCLDTQTGVVFEVEVAA